MFSIGFSELLVIAVVTLLLVGPERLPETIRFFSMHLAKFRRYWQTARRDIEKELGLDDLRREIHNADVMERLKETKNKLNETMNADIEQKASGLVPLSESSSSPIEKVEAALDSQADAQNSILTEPEDPASGELFSDQAIDKS